MSNNTHADNGTVQNRLSVTTPKSTTRTDKAETELDQLEEIITENLQGSFKLAAALVKIRDAELFKPEFTSFEEYCKKRWDYSRSYCHRLCEVDGVLSDLKELPKTVALPKNEAQARIFVNLEKDERIGLAEKVAEEADDTELTAALIARFKKELFPDKCISASKKKTPAPPVIDIEAMVEVVADKPNLTKIHKTIIKLQHLMLSEERQGVLGALIEELNEYIGPWVNREEPQAVTRA